jgi:hypothetical protein
MSDRRTVAGASASASRFAEVAELILDRVPLPRPTTRPDTPA